MTDEPLVITLMKFLRLIAISPVTGTQHQVSFSSHLEYTIDWHNVAGESRSRTYFHTQLNVSS